MVATISEALAAYWERGCLAHNNKREDECRDCLCAAFAGDYAGELRALLDADLSQPPEVKP